MRKVGLLLLLLGAPSCSPIVGRAPEPAVPYVSAPSASTTPEPSPSPAPLPSSVSCEDTSRDGVAGCSDGMDAEDAPSDAEPIEDGYETPEPAPNVALAPAPHPFASKSDQDLERMLVDDPKSLGSLTIGRTNGGMLINGVQMPQGARWELIDPAHAWGTQETVDALARCIDKVHDQFPSSPKMQIGHISGKRGGPLSPHRSHQSGRDVDVSYYYNSPTRWFARAHAGNLDVARTWAFVRALIVETDVEMILIDHSLQKLLRDHALSIGEDEPWVDGIFRGQRGGRPAIIRHARGHGTHIHVRFYNPIAQESARRVYPLLAKHGKVEPPTQYVMHKVRKGETLGMLARKYGTTVEAIKRANGLRSNLIRAKRSYRIPRVGAAPVVVRAQQIAFPRRSLPPHPPSHPLPAPVESTGGADASPGA